MLSAQFHQPRIQSNRIGSELTKKKVNPFNKEKYEKLMAINIFVIQKSHKIIHNHRPISATDIGMRTSEISKNISPQVFHPIHDLDVLNGRGVAMNRHPGNIQYLAMVRSLSSQYRSSSKIEKMQFSYALLRILNHNKVRFLDVESCKTERHSLHKNPTIAPELTQIKSIEKISQAFRDDAAHKLGSLGKRKNKDETDTPLTRQKLKQKPAQQSSSAQLIETDNNANSERQAEIDAYLKMVEDDDSDTDLLDINFDNEPEPDIQATETDEIENYEKSLIGLYNPDDDWKLNKADGLKEFDQEPLDKLLEQISGLTEKQIVQLVNPYVLNESDTVINSHSGIPITSAMQTMGQLINHYKPRYQEKSSVVDKMDIINTLLSEFEDRYPENRFLKFNYQNEQYSLVTITEVQQYIEKQLSE